MGIKCRSRREQNYCESIFNKRIHAALTVEAAVVMPLFLLAMCTLLGLLDCYRVQSLVKISIHRSAMELGMYAYVREKDETDIDIVNTALCMSYAQSKLPKFEKNVSVSMIGSNYKDGKIKLIANITYKFPITLFPMPALKMVNVSEVYSWVGVHEIDGIKLEIKDYKMVYVTQNASVYHTSSSCSHIEIETYKSKLSKLDSKYEACQKCCENQEIKENQSVYYTKTGRCYHSTKACSSLKRIIRMVELSEVKNLPICDRCKERSR